MDIKRDEVRMTALDTHLARLMKCSPPPPHIGVRVVELTGQNEKDKELGEYLGEGTFAPWRIKASAMHTPEEYAARFDELLAQGYAWINLQWLGIQDGLLVATITLPRETAGVQRTSVNLSGPTNLVKSHNWAISPHDLGLDVRPPFRGEAAGR